MNNAKVSILITVYKTLCQGQNQYSLISINKIIQLLQKFHGLKVKRRWVFACMKYLIDQGYLQRRARYKNKKPHKFHRLSSLLFVTAKGAQFLTRKGVVGAHKMWIKLVAAAKSQLKKEKKDNLFKKDKEKPISEGIKGLVDMVANRIQPLTE